MSTLLIALTEEKTVQQLLEVRYLPKKGRAKTKCQDCPSKDYKELKGTQIRRGFAEDADDVVKIYLSDR